MNFVQILSISLIAGALILAFGIAYLKYKENILRIQRNEPPVKSGINLMTYGIILIGLAVGTTLATIVNELFFNRYGMLIYFIFLTLSAGVSMIISHRLKNN